MDAANLAVQPPVMHIGTWIAFTFAYAALAATPGPVTLLVMSYALTSGRRTAFSVVAATTLGDVTCCLLAAAGLGALIAASATAFTVLKVIGAAYLIVLGVRMWRAAAEAVAASAAMRPRSMARMFGHAYLTTVLNPKTVLFFMVFLPQFIDSQRSLLPQLTVMLPTILVIGGLIDAGYSLSAGMMRRFLHSPRWQARLGRACGGLLVGEGVAAMAIRLA